MNKSPSWFYRYRQVLLYGFGLACLLLLLKWVEYRFVIRDHAFEVYAGIIALIFTGLGVWLALKLARPKTVVVEVRGGGAGQGEFVRDEERVRALGLSARELEVLECMAAGCSNQEISDRLFVSLNTVKTHSTRIFSKLDAKRRTQAVEKARQLGIIP